MILAHEKMFSVNRSMITRSKYVGGISEEGDTLTNENNPSKDVVEEVFDDVEETMKTMKNNSIGNEVLVFT